MHPELWVVSNDTLQRNSDTKLLQSLVADVGADEAEAELVRAGASKVIAKKLVDQALLTPPLI